MRMLPGGSFVHIGETPALPDGLHIIVYFLLSQEKVAGTLYHLLNTTLSS